MVTSRLSTSEAFFEWLDQDPEFAEQQADSKPSRDAATLLVRARLQLGLTQTEFAKNAGVSQAYISALESGASNPSLCSIARVLRRNGVELRLDTAFTATVAKEAHQDGGLSSAVENDGPRPANSFEHRVPSRKNAKRLSA